MMGKHKKGYWHSAVRDKGASLVHVQIFVFSICWLLWYDKLIEILPIYLLRMHMHSATYNNRCMTHTHLFQKAYDNLLIILVNYVKANVK